MGICECKNKILSLSYQNDTFKVYGKLQKDNKITIKYIGKLINKNTDKIYIQYGYGNSWENKNSLEMSRCSFSDVDAFCCNFKIINEGDLNLVFIDGNNNWDLNENSSYSLKIEPRQVILAKKVSDLTLENEFKENEFTKIIKLFKSNILIFFKNIKSIFTDNTIKKNS